MSRAAFGIFAGARLRHSRRRRGRASMTEAQTSQPSVIARSDGAIRVLTLNRPDKLNAADLEMQQRLLTELQDVARDPEARALILTGAGRAFSISPPAPRSGAGPPRPRGSSVRRGLSRP